MLLNEKIAVVSPEDAITTVPNHVIEKLVFKRFEDNSWAQFEIPNVKTIIFDADVLTSEILSMKHAPILALNPNAQFVLDFKKCNCLQEIMILIENLGIRDLVLKASKKVYLSTLPRNLVSLRLYNIIIDPRLVSRTRQPELKSFVGKFNDDYTYDDHSHVHSYSHVLYVDLTQIYSMKISFEGQFIETLLKIAAKVFSSESVFHCKFENLDFDVFECHHQYWLKILKSNNAQVKNLRLMRFEDSGYGSNSLYLSHYDKWLTSSVEFLQVGNIEFIFDRDLVYYSSNPQPSRLRKIGTIDGRFKTTILQHLRIKHFVFDREKMSTRNMPSYFPKCWILSLNISNFQNPESWCLYFIQVLCKNQHLVIINAAINLSSVDQQRIIDESGRNVCKIGGTLFRDVQRPIIQGIFGRHLIPVMTNEVMSFL